MSKRFSPYFPKSAPREVVGGIRAKSARGEIAANWWSKRFIAELETIGLGSRLARGKNYARRGQAESIEIAPGQVTASVQGSRARPYRVRIGITAYGKREWALIEEELSRDAWFVAQLLSGTIPPDMEQVFQAVGLELLPGSDLSLDCSCPDWEVPCKHIAAVFYLLAERFDEDPFELLAWRGRTRAELLAQLALADHAEDAAEPVGEPLADLLDVFYVPAGAGVGAGVGVAVSEYAESDGVGVLPQLPPLALRVRGKALSDALLPAYRHFADSPTAGLR